MIRWIAILGLTACITAGAGSAWAGFNEGLDAYGKGDYERAFREFREAAEQGHLRAQATLGVM